MAESVRLHLGDCLSILPILEAGSVDAVCTDPPAGIGFMGKTWDDPGTMDYADGYVRRGRMPADATSTRNPFCRRCRGRMRAGPKTRGCTCGAQDWDVAERRVEGREAFIAFLSAVMAECYRVARPGAYALVWAIPRTSHWTATAVEDAGWVIQDKIYHLFGTGFPKHKSKLKPACEEWVLAWKPDRKATPLQIDACRIGTEQRVNGPASSLGVHAYCGNPGKDEWRDSGRCRELAPRVVAGRWPSNVCISHKSLPVMRLVGNILPDVANTIGRYFHDYHRLRDLRQERFGRALSGASGSEVLRQGVCGRGQAGKAQGRTDRVDVPDVRERVPVSSIMDEERPSEVLWGGLQACTPSDVDGREVAPLRDENELDRPATNGPGGPESRVGPQAARGKASELEGRDAHQCRLSSRQDQLPVAGGSGVGPADGPERRLHPGASDRHGPNGRASLDPSRDRAPSERGQARQSAGEFADHRERPALAEASGDDPRDCDAPGGDGPLEVLAEDVPAGWLEYFELTGEDLGCREIGTRRVKGSGKDGPRYAAERTGHGGFRVGRVGTSYVGPDGTETVPAFACHEDCAVAQLDAQSGERPSGSGNKNTRNRDHRNAFGSGLGKGNGDGIGGDSGGASRFFFTPKAPRAERWFYCRDCGDAYSPVVRDAHLHGHYTADGRPDWRHLTGHPTQKSLALMGWLMRLICPPGGTILDPFSGSGSTGEAAALEGFGFVGIDRDPEYHAIAGRRIAAVRCALPLFPEAAS